MNTRFLMSFCLLISIQFSLSAQHNVALQSNGQTTIFNGVNPFIDAYEMALDGDTIYLPGGGFDAPGTLDKGIAIFGAGFHPDSTLATLPTVINTNILIGEGASNLHLEGLHMLSLTKYAGTEIDNVSVVHCRMAAYNMADIGAFGVSNNFLLAQSVVTGDVTLSGLIGALVTNCIFQNRLYYSESNTISNNIFLVEPSVSYYVLRYSNNNVISNNIFRTTYPYITGPAEGNVFQNNAFAHSAPILGSTATSLNNYVEVDMATVFVNQSGTDFNYDQDYHLQADAATNLLGENGQPVGIYFGMLPFKEGAVPKNPHISFKSIDTQTNNSGELNIQIQVAAQND